MCLVFQKLAICSLFDFTGLLAAASPHSGEYGGGSSSDKAIQECHFPSGHKGSCDIHQSRSARGFWAYQRPDVSLSFPYGCVSFSATF